MYRNLNNGLMSVQVKVPGKGWLVAGHVTDLVLSGVTFHVSERGRQRVLRDRCKNVHAWAQGLLVAEYRPDLVATVDLKYNPYTDQTFVQRQTQMPVHDCQFLVVRNNRVFVSADALAAPVKPKAFTLKSVTYKLPEFNGLITLWAS